MPASTVSDHNQRVWARFLSAFNYRKTEGLNQGEQAILDRLGTEVSRARLLDIGVGTGRTTGVLEGRVARYAGCDYSPAMVKRARKRCPTADIEVADARALRVHQDGAFDIVLFSFNGIDNVSHEDRLRVLAEVRRVLAPGGTFIFSSHNRAWTGLKPWALANLRLSWHPKRIVRGVGVYTLGILNHWRMSGHQRHEDEYAILNDSGEEYLLLQYFIRAEDQLRQLERAGFRDVEVFGVGGERVEPHAASARDFMLHYLARRV